MTILTKDDLALAAEAALGLLEPAEQAQVQARMTQDLAFADEVNLWQGRLLSMVEGIDEQPPARVWNAVADEILPSSGQDNRLSWWKGLSLVSTSAAAIMGFLLINQQSQPVAPHTTLVAALGGPSQPASMAANYDGDSGELVLTPVAVNTGSLYPELWVIPVGGAAASLGIIRADGPSRIKVSIQLRAALATGATLAITPEPSGGAPGGKATGPILASGKITTI
jgi:anti-sigma-K factor RskA